MKRGQWVAVIVAMAVLALLVLWFGRRHASASVQAAVEPGVPVTVETLTLDGNADKLACTGAFVTHKLPFATGTRLREIGTYCEQRCRRGG